MGKPPGKLISRCCILADLIEAIETAKEPVLSAEHARHVLEIMTKIPEAAKRSCASGKCEIVA